MTNSNTLLVAMRRQMSKPMQCILPLKTDIMYTATLHAFPTFTFPIPHLDYSALAIHLHSAGCPPPLPIPQSALTHDFKLQ